MAVFSSLWKWLRPSKAQATTIMALPDELLLEIAPHLQFTSNRSPSDNFFIPSDLVALSATCHLFNALVSPLILRDVHVTSSKRLLALSALPRQKLALIRYARSQYMDDGSG